MREVGPMPDAAPAFPTAGAADLPRHLADAAARRLADAAARGLAALAPRG